jgi:hypothetical protein
MTSMDSGTIIALTVVVVVVLAVIAAAVESNKVSKMSPEEAAAYQAQKMASRETMIWGPLNPPLVCPHCQEKGQVRAKTRTQKKGISGGKATAAVLTAGTSLLAVGLSRKEKATQAHCGNCNSTWQF